MIGRIFTKETRKIMSDSRLKDKNSFFGKSHNLELIKKISNSLKGQNYPKFSKFGEENLIVLN